MGFKLAEMHTRIAAARALVLEAAAKKDRGERYTLEASTAKLFASEVAVSVTREAVQVLGGMATTASTGWSATTAMPRLPRYTRAPARYRSWSSLESSTAKPARLQPWGRWP